MGIFVSERARTLHPFHKQRTHLLCLRNSRYCNLPPGKRFVFQRGNSSWYRNCSAADYVGAWSGSQQLVHALQFITLAANILDTQELELITTGLAQLLDRSTIGPNDTIESASEKGDIRRNAVRLSRKLSTEKLSEYMKDILLRWQRIGQDKNEFAEIRTAW